MKKQLLATAYLVLGLAFIGSAQSVALYGGSVLGKNILTGGTDIDVADSLYIGSGPHNIDGTWEIYSTYIQVDPNAVISGSGTIVLYNPSAGFGASGPTYIDVNNISNPIDVNVEIQNDQTIRLTELPFSGDLTSSGWVESFTNNSFNAGRDVSFGIDGGHLVLGNTVQADLVFDNDATVSNYRPARHVVTNNSILSHVTKQNYTSAFTFPVGIAAGDYTPAQISNTANNTVSVSVQDYVNSASPEALLDGTVNTADGMNRTWHVFAGTSGISSTVNLQHNASSNQTGFVDATHFVTQWGTTTPNTTGDFTIPYSMSPWQTNTQGPGVVGTLSSTGAVAGSSLRGRTYASGLATSSSANESYFTKSADSEHPLPLSLIRFSAGNSGCNAAIEWQSANEDNVDRYVIQHSRDGATFSTVGTVNALAKGGSYRFIHELPGNGINLYRLQIMERSGTYTVSKVVTTILDCASSLSQVKAYPNPTYGGITLNGLRAGKISQDTKVLIRVLSLEGKVILEKPTTQNDDYIDISTFAQASYIVQILHDQVVAGQFKIVKL